ncbi:unnamed protein product [Brassica rapa]|uniref:Uncharacterized protein n=1 Tax=Brassica campestris TaxID=3711 RepID=A0A8D9MF22_BRACM|nr:unnamed protein product [Brassica rapa]
MFRFIWSLGEVSLPHTLSLEMIKLLLPPLCTLLLKLTLLPFSAHLL